MSKTIAGAIVELAIAYGADSGSQAKTIDQALDLLNDTLAGSDQTAEGTIAYAISGLSENIVPSGTLEVTTNGTHNCAGYAKVKVTVA